MRISGPQTAALAQRLVRSREPLQPRRATLARIVDNDGSILDRGIALFFPGPGSFTGEDVLELQIHGSPVVAREVVAAFIAAGARAAAPGEFTRRAWLSGKLDLHAAAAVGELIDAETRSAARAALANLGGGLASEVRSLRAQLAESLEELAAAIDFPDEVPTPPAGRLEEKLGEIAAALERLARDGERGRLVREGIGVAIVGPPNAGKSSLLNALLGEERAIVSEIAGTTRDTIEERIAIDGVPVRLIDTAGIRAHAERLEAAGIERSRLALAGARVALIVVDGSQPLDDTARELIALTAGRPRVLFFNKADLGRAAEPRALDGEIVSGSVYDAGTVGELRAAIGRAGWGGEAPDLERPHIAAAREFDAIAQALEALAHARATLQSGDPVDLIAGELQRAFAALGHVSGDLAAEEVVDGIFARFCIGK